MRSFWRWRDMGRMLSWISLCYKSKHGRRSESCEPSPNVHSKVFQILSSADQVLDVAANVITSIKQQNFADKQPHSPIVLNCISGAERSGLVSLGITTVFATQMRKPTLLSEFYNSYHWATVSSILICRCRWSLVQNLLAEKRCPRRRAIHPVVPRNCADQRTQNIE